MKLNLFKVSVLTSAVVVVVGCQSTSNQTSTASTAGSASTPAPVVTPVAPPTVAPTPAPVPAGSAKTIRINAGGAAVKDAKGVEWLADTGFVGGDVIERPDMAIDKTQQPEIYRSEHYSMESFSAAVPNGNYQVKLHFCETYEGIAGPGERVFSFDVEGKAFKDFDVWAKSGGAAKAYVETVNVSVADGKLDVKFTPNIENPQINGIEIIPAN